MIQDIYPHKLHNEYDPKAKPLPEEAVLVFKGADVLTRIEGDQLFFPTVSMFEEDTMFTYLFSLDETRYFRAVKPEGMDGFTFVGSRDLWNNKNFPKETIYAIMTAQHLSDWYRDTSFCGRCGSKMEHSLTERAMHCSSCGYTAYPRIMPAVIVGVKNNGKILITKYNRGFAHNALIAGFVEIGETVEETVQREVMEEAGIKVKNIRYYKSQPWGTANDILVGYYCDVDGDDTIKMDDSELKFASWLKPEEIVLQPYDFSLTNEMMKRFKDGLEV